MHRGEPMSTMHSFLTIAQKVYDYYHNHRDDILSFIPVSEQPPIAEEKDVDLSILLI
jgi:hypothetical protein